MKKSTYYFFIIALIIILFKPVYSADTLYDTYETEIGITINSYAENWTGQKLIDIYNELLNNTHGGEINYLKEINIYPTNPRGGKEEGIYNAVYSKISVLGKEKIIISKENSIELYNMKDKDKVEDIARTLSHEYGHHFTLFYLIKYENKTFEQWKDTILYRVREANKYPKIVGDYSNGHKWNFIEICAEDYVQLYGSPLAKKVYDFDDIKDRYSKGKIDKVIRYDYSTYNINPQENNEIPLALNLPNLKEYWEAASGIKTNCERMSIPNIALTKVEDIGHNKLQYTIQWTKSVDAQNQEAKFYTVVALDETGKEIIPIKTVARGEPRITTVGSIKITKENKIIYYTDNFINRPVKILVYAFNETGGVVGSNELRIDFENPQIGKLEDTPFDINVNNKLEFPEKTEESRFLTFIYKLILFLIHNEQRL